MGRGGAAQSGTAGYGHHQYTASYGSGWGGGIGGAPYIHPMGLGGEEILEALHAHPMRLGGAEGLEGGAQYTSYGSGWGRGIEGA